MTLSASFHFAPLPGAPRAAPRRVACRHAAAPVHRWAARAWIALLVFGMIAPRAWDVDAMLQAARLQGPQAVAGATALQAVLARLTGQDEHAKLTAINEFFNRRIVFATDMEVWGQLDYWASPLELLGKGRGDCEDYVIAKYFSLLLAGVPVSKLRLVYVRATIGGPGGEVIAHMVLAYYPAPDAEPLILDNLLGEMRTASRRPDLAPVFSFNGEGLWQGVGPQSAGDPQARLSRWRDVMAKARAEGFR